MLRRLFSRSLLWLIYLIVGFIVAISHHYITLFLVKVVLSAVFAVLLWWLVLLGLNLHLH